MGSAVRGHAAHHGVQTTCTAYEPVFADAAYWKPLGEAYQNPIVVTGTMFFTIEHELIRAGRLDICTSLV